MPLHIQLATASDLPEVAVRISEIHMAAFSSNAMLLAQFPTPAIRSALRDTIKKKAIADINDAETAVLLVIDSELPEEGGKNSISFAKWVRPHDESEDYEEPAWEWPPGTDLSLIGEWTAKVEGASERVLGKRKHWHLTFLATDPRHIRRGAATMLIEYGVELATKDNVPAYLESTWEAGPLYERCGFKANENLSMTLQLQQDGGESLVYEETCYIFEPIHRDVLR